MGAAKNMELYNTTKLTAKAIISEKATDKKAISAVLKNASKMMEAAFSAIVKDDDKRARNVANAAKGRYQSAVAIVANCWPYQTADGRLLKKAKADDGRTIWAEKAVTAVAARGLLKEALNNFIASNGQPAVIVAEIGAEVPVKAKKADK